MNRQRNRAVGTLGNARLDLWESQFYTDGASLRNRRAAKKASVRARRLLDRAILREDSFEGTSNSLTSGLARSS